MNLFEEQQKKAVCLMLIDLQNDFFSGGALPVPNSNIVIPIACELIKLCIHHNISVIASQDWHPLEHRAFAVNAGVAPSSTGELDGIKQTFWPVHCIQNKYGAQLHPLLPKKNIKKIFHKGMDPNIDSYSVFFDNGRRKNTELDDWLKKQSVTHLLIMGIATDYCVKYSVIDALSCGYQVTVIVNGCCGINQNSQDSKIAMNTMKNAGAHLCYSKEISDNIVRYN